jgi:hypothetical protein
MRRESGSIAAPSFITAKCRCAPVVMPVRPMKPITWPAFTTWPVFTGGSANVSSRCAYSET